MANYDRRSRFVSIGHVLFGVDETATQLSVRHHWRPRYVAATSTWPVCSVSSAAVCLSVCDTAAAVATTTTGGWSCPPSASSPCYTLSSFSSAADHEVELIASEASRWLGDTPGQTAIARPQSLTALNSVSSAALSASSASSSASAAAWRTSPVTDVTVQRVMSGGATRSRTAPGIYLPACPTCLTQQTIYS